MSGSLLSCSTATPSLRESLARSVDVTSYLDWVYTSPSSARPRLFSSTVLERLSSTHPAIVPLCWLPAVFLALTTAAARLSAFSVAVLFVAGWAFWLFLEYFLHRFVFHVDHRLPPFAWVRISQPPRAKKKTRPHKPLNLNPNPALAGMFPRDNLRHTRFAVNFFTSIGLGALTDELRDFLKKQQQAAAATVAAVLQ